jgi:protein KTI12
VVVGDGKYGSAEEEKITRAEIFAAIERELAKDVLVVVDALNYIKGFRYQLHCSAKALSTPMCVVWCQGGGDATSELGSRFEAPDERNRWDRPLIIARRGSILVSPSSSSSPPPPMQLDWDRLEQSVCEGVRAPPNMGTLAEPRSLVHDTDKALSGVVAAVLQAQKEGGALLLPRHVTMAEMRLWKREYLNLLDAEKADVGKSFLQFCIAKTREGEN